MIKRFDANGNRRAAQQTISRQAWNTRVTLTYRNDPRWEAAVDVQIRIVRRGKQLFAGRVFLDREGESEPLLGVHSRRGFVLRDLDGDDEPEVMLMPYSRGTHCCVWSRIYRYRPGSDTYVVVEHMWANSSATPRIRDLNGDGKLEFITSDERFDYDGPSYASSLRPIQIWSYDRGRFRDVTRSYPALVRTHLRGMWPYYRQFRRRTTADDPTPLLGVLGAWAAEKYMLGEGADVQRLLKRDLVAAAVRDELMKRLRNRGYLRG